MTNQIGLNRGEIESALAEALAAIRASADLRPGAAATVLRQLRVDCEHIHRLLERQLVLLEATAPEIIRDDVDERLVERDGGERRQRG